MKEKSFNVTFLGKTYPAHYVKTNESAAYVINKLLEKDVLFAIDTETKPKKGYGHMKEAGLSPHLGEIRLIQVFDGTNIIIFDMVSIDSEMFLDFLESKRFIAHNALFDLQFFKALGVRTMNIGCTLICSRLLFHAIYPTDMGLSGSLSNMVKTLLGVDLKKAMQASDWSDPELTFEQVEYAALDPLAVTLIAEKLAGGIQKYKLGRIYTIMKEAQHPIAAMQMNGIGFDAEAHVKVIPTWVDKLVKAKKEVMKLTGLTKLTATTLGVWLEENLPEDVLNIWPRTDKGRLSTDAHTLSDFAWLDIVKPFSEYQKQEKLTSTYGSNLLHRVNPATKRLHASYNLCGARTGRLSSSHPNLQNIPARDKEFKKRFIPRDGYIFICADYNQIELRVAAELSKDEMMLKAYREGIDLHRLTASKVSGKPLADVTDEERQMAKAVNFGLLFGLGVKKFAHYANKSYGVTVSDAEAERAVNTFRETYPQYREWQLAQANNAAVTFKTVTPCGKLRRLPEDNTFGNSMNHPVQGGAAEVMLVALTKLHKELPDDTYLVNCVHDEILVEVPDDKHSLVYAAVLVQSCMTTAFLDIFPNGVTKGIVKLGKGHSWAEAK